MQRDQNGQDGQNQYQILTIGHKDLFHLLKYNYLFQFSQKTLNSLMQPSQIPKLLPNQQRPSYGNTYEPTDRLENDNMLKEFQTLKQINRILDSNPESEQAKDQKIRSLVVMFKRQLDINKKLQNQLVDQQKKIQGLQRELLVRNTQVKNYEKTIFEQKQSIVAMNSDNKRLIKQIEENKQEIKVREDLIQKMKQTYENQKYSMENQLHFLKQKTLEHFTQKLKFPIESWSLNKEITKISRSKSRPTSTNTKENKSGKSSSMPKQKSSKKDIIRKNILAISKKQNQLMSGQSLLKKFEQTKFLSERMGEIRKGNYHSALANNF